MNLVKPGTTFDFVAQRRSAAIVSVILVAVSLVLFFVKGPNWGIDFTGGTEVHLKFKDSVEISDVRTALQQLDLGSDAAQQIGADEEGEYVIRIQDPELGTSETRSSVESALKSTFGAEWISETDFTAEVGARLTVRYLGDAVTIDSVQEAVKDIPGARAAPALDDNVVYINLPGLATQIGGKLKESMKDRSLMCCRLTP